MCLRAQCIDEKNGSVSRVIQERGLSNNYGGVGRGRGVDDASEGSETTAEVGGGRRRSQLIYDDDGGVGGGR